MALMYALSCHMDYLDEELLSSHASEIRADLTCPSNCSSNQPQHLLVSSR
jgi:hypothetical protein